ncbi:MAG TPA: xanthine dehydrogenase molybdopterin binding subunit [Xanthobacteraceae bacterium]|nr:xanthine dehydrogenase molybdopterin binding subunit [Xanthobacteraceae bacterium]
MLKPRGSFRTGVGAALTHDSAGKHVSGTATYIDDMPEASGTLHAALVLSPLAHGTLRGIDAETALAQPGVVAILRAGDIPGVNDAGPIEPNEPLFAEAAVEYVGHPVAAIIAETLDAARSAAKLVKLDIAPLDPILSVEDAVARNSLLCPPMIVSRGDAAAALARAPHRISHRLRVGGQEHFYLEGQVALAVPGEDGDMAVYSSTQNPSEAQHIVARLLGVELNRVTCIVRRLGGGFGGKESNSSAVAGIAALAAWRTRRPVKLRLPRVTDMVMTGKRHGYLIDYTIGFDDDGRILALEATLASNGGNTLDHTAAVMGRALCHIDNAYWIPDVRAVGLCCKTNTVSNTAFRGYGSPQASLALEDAIDRMACVLGKPADALRELNFYGGEGRDVTPYGQKVADNLIARCVAQAKANSEWQRRRSEIDAFNASSKVLKRGLAVFPVKFGISFNAAHLNQAGAFVNIYSDGSIRLNHGGTEMGQGLFTKVAQVVAEVFQVDLDRISLAATSTGEVPNTSPTAASTGSDLNGWAAYEAASTLKRRMIEFTTEKFGVPPEQVDFRDNHVHIGGPASNHILEFGELAKLCWLGRVSLSATGFYRTPDLHWNRETMKGSPFFYFSFGASVAEVAVDTLTGEMRALRADLVQDCGRSLNPAIDVGQIEGAFVQGLGWLTNEELWWDKEGRLRTVGPSTYKIPGSRDVPPIFNARILEDAPARVATIFRSKGVGEPPLLLAIAVWSAIRDAIGSLASHQLPVDLDAPATPERILMAIGDLQERMAKA